MPRPALVAGVVAVAHAAVEHVGHGLEAAVRVFRKAGEVVARPVRAELVEHQEGIQPVELPGADHARELDPGAVAGGLAAQAMLHGADRAGTGGHGTSGVGGGHEVWLIAPWTRMQGA